MSESAPDAWQAKHDPLDSESVTAVSSLAAHAFTMIGWCCGITTTHMSASVLRLTASVLR